MKTCIVTGANGFLGREVVAALAKDWNVIALSHTPRENFRAIDLREREQVAALVRETSPDAVVHLAAYREPDFCEDNPAETKRLNVDPVEFFLAALKPTAQFLFVSTDYVFDGLAPPYAETAPCKPVSEYGRSKLAAENLLRDRRNAIVLRVPLLMGAGPTFNESGFIAQMIHAVTNTTPQKLDDVLIRWPCWTLDAVGAISFLLAGNHEGTFHLSGPRGGTRYFWTLETAKLLGKPHDHLTPSKIVIPRKAGRPPDSQLDDTKLRALGYKTSTDPMRVVRSVLAQFKISP